MATTSQPLTPNFSLSDYGKFLAAGGLCATITHGGMTPIDVVKTRLQLEPKGSKETMLSMGRNIIAKEGPGGLLTGFGPTAVGYLIQGGSKFCFFEVGKKIGVELAGSQEAAQRNRTAIYVLGASGAEIIASTLLTPLEAARIRLVSDRTYAKGLASALARVFRDGQAFAGYIPILFKQVPYSVGQFTVNELMHEVSKNTISEETMEKAGKTGELTVQLGCGLVAGAAAAVLSHPADTLLSKMNKGEGGNTGSAFHKLAVCARGTGFAGLWAGLGTRTLMTMFLVSGQFLIYAQIKQAIGAPPGIEIAKVDTEKKN